MVGVTFKQQRIQLGRGDAIVDDILTLVVVRFSPFRIGKRS